MSNKKILILILALLIISIFFYWQRMSFSKEILKIEIIGPDKASLGSEIEYVVKFKNTGSIRLENPEMYFEFPESSIIDSGERVERVELDGDIYPGQEGTKKFTARLIGKENEAKTAKAAISFQPKDLKSRNEVSTTFTTIINEIPINFSFEVPAKSGSGKALSLRASYYSSIPYSLKDVSFTMEYPEGFEFLYSVPKALDNDQWDIPVLNQSASGKIEISGILSGDSLAQKVFKAKMGIWQNGQFIVLKEIVKTVEIISSSIYLTQKINNVENYLANVGDQLHYEVFFRNTGEVPLTNMALIARLEGSGLDFNSIKAPEGIYQDGDNSIIFDGSKVPQLQFLSIGEEGKIDFWVDVKKNWPMTSLANKNPIIKNKVTIGEARQDFLTKVRTVIVADQKIYLEDKYFDNSGPYPLQANAKTTFTVEWSASNYYSDLNNAKMVTVLPESVIFEKQTWPEDVDLTYDEDTGELIWNIGTLEAGQGTLKETKKCAFQLSTQPQIIEQDIFLLGSAQLSGVDQWTGEEVLTKTNIVYGEVDR